MPKNDKQQRREIMRALSLLSHIGITIAVCILIGVLLGRFLDSVLGTSPWLLLVFSLLGTAAAFKSLLDIAKK
jgi:ATP synthase protein I